MKQKLVNSTPKVTPWLTPSLQSIPTKTPFLLFTMFYGKLSIYSIWPKLHHHLLNISTDNLSFYILLERYLTGGKHTLRNGYTKYHRFVLNSSDASNTLKCYNLFYFYSVLYIRWTVKLIELDISFNLRMRRSTIFPKLLWCDMKFLSYNMIPIQFNMLSRYASIFNYWYKSKLVQKIYESNGYWLLIY